MRDITKLVKEENLMNGQEWIQLTKAQILTQEKNFEHSFINKRNKSFCKEKLKTQKASPTISFKL